MPYACVTRINYYKTQTFSAHFSFTTKSKQSFGASEWDGHLEQEALLWQRDRATRLSVEILQLQNIPIVWHYLRDPTFSRFYTIPDCDRHTHTDGRTDTRRRHVGLLR